jgi:hypothetical protein
VQGPWFEFEGAGGHLLHLDKQPLIMQCVDGTQRCMRKRCCTATTATAAARGVFSPPQHTQHLSMVSGQVSRRRLPSTQRAYREVWMNAW